MNLQKDTEEIKGKRLSSRVRSKRTSDIDPMKEPSFLPLTAESLMRYIKTVSNRKSLYKDLKVCILES